MPRLNGKTSLHPSAAQGIGLASDEASHINGEVIEVSGGMTV